jgi:exonuclease SbcC
MIFKKIRLENIRSYEDLEIEFPHGSVLLSGEIGSGKTSILLGLQFALFGLQPGQKGSSILRQGKDVAYACLHLEVDGQEVVLERSIKKSKSGSITQDENAITIDSKREELSTSEMKERVVRLLNYPKEFIKKSNLLYKFTVYTPQEEMKAIVEENPEVRLDTLRHIFGIDRYKRIKENAQIFLQKIKDSIKIKEVLISELNLLKEKLVLENEKKISLSKEVNNLSVEFSNLLNAKNEAEVKMNKNLQRIDEKRKTESELIRLQTALQGKKDWESRMKKEMSIMQKQVSQEVEFSPQRLKSVLELFIKHKKILEEKQNEYLEVSSKVSALEFKKEHPLHIKDKIASIDNCPTCLQSVGKEHKEKIAKKAQYEIEDINRSLEQKIIEKERLAREIDKEKELIRGYEEDKNSLQQNKIKFEHQKELEIKLKSDAFILDRVSNEVIQINKQIEVVNTHILGFFQIQEIYDLAKKEFQEIYDLHRKKEILVATKKKELEILVQKISELDKEIGQKEKVRSQVNFLRGLQDWLSDKFIMMINLTEKNVMSKLRSEFSKIFSEWFSLLVSDSLSVRLNEDFTPIITNQDYEIDYDFLSGGERTATALAYRLALNQVLNSILSRIKTKDVVILDEPTDGFASEQIDKMRDIFDQLKANQIILVSHEQRIEGFVDHVIRVRKDKVSKIGQP